MSAIGRLSQRSQLIILGVLILALCGVFYMYMIGPLRGELKQIEEQIRILELEVETGQAVRDQLEELKRAVREQEARLSHLRRVLPEKKETAEIIRQVQQLAVDSRLHIKSFTPRATVNQEFYEDWPILISLEGNYNSLGSFFEKISRFTRIINVDNINIRSVGEGSTRDRTLTATCTATTFVYIDPSTEESE
jgi:type IV pilus assembly protein PilO